MITLKLESIKFLHFSQEWDWYYYWIEKPEVGVDAVPPYLPEVGLIISVGQVNWEDLGMPIVMAFLILYRSKVKK